MNYKLLYEMEREENQKLKKELFLVRTRLIEEKSIRKMFSERSKEFAKERDELIQTVSQLKAQSVIQNVAPKEKLVERIIIETYKAYA